MLNRNVYAKDPGQHEIKNKGVAAVSDGTTPEELSTLRFELETFVCEGEYERGLKLILSEFLRNLNHSEQPGVWVSGFYGSGKSHLVKMLRALWVNTTFPEDGATARGLVNVPKDIDDLLKELDTAQRRAGGIHAASGTPGSGPADIRLALLAIVFKSVGLAEQYPLARFEMWLKSLNFYDRVRETVEAQGKSWHAELRNLYVSPVISGAVHQVYPDLAPSAQDVRDILRVQYPTVESVSNQEMVDAIRGALSVDGKFPLTLIALDEVQQYIGDDPQKSYAIQEVVETCSKSFGGKLMFVATGQTSLSGTPNLQKLTGRFNIKIELSDNDVDAVIRKVILAKKAETVEAIQQALDPNHGEISRHLEGTKIAPRDEDRSVLIADYPILPVRRRFWEKALRAVDHGGTSSQVRTQLKIVHDAIKETADLPLGHVVGGDFIFENIAPSLLQSKVLSGEVYDTIRRLHAGDEKDKLSARILSLIFLIGKLPRELNAADLGVRARPDTLADLLIENLHEGSAQLRRDIPPLLDALERAGHIMCINDEYRLQTRESSDWNNEFQNQYDQLMGAPQRLAQERIDLFRKEVDERTKTARQLTHGESKERRDLAIHFGTEAPADLRQKLYIWVRDGWEEEEKNFLADVQAAGNESPTIYVYVPRHAGDEIRRNLAVLRAATGTLQRKGTSHTAEGEEARGAIQTKVNTSQRQLTQLLDETFSQARVYLGGGREIANTSLQDAIRQAGQSTLSRLYPRFNDADQPGWAKVVERAQKGAEDSLQAVAHEGTIDKHPVTAAILKFIAGGKKGAEILKHFGEPPYGWTRDAIEGGLYALVATGHLRATDSGAKAVDAKKLERKQIAHTQFRMESVTINAAQRIHIRKLISELGISCASNEELSQLPTYLRKMRELAASAGGDAPLPERPSIPLLQELEALAGNELLAGVHANQESLRKFAADWQAQSTAIQNRIGQWQTLKRLLSHAAELSEATEVRNQADAILQQRLLLADPDPLPTLLGTLTQILRDALIRERDAYARDFAKGEERLKADVNWAKLDADGRHKIRQTNQITKIPEIQTGTTQDILQSLQGCSLSEWGHRRPALSGRFESALRDAATAVLPNPRFVQISRGTLNTHDEVDAWVERLRQQIKNELDAADGAPVVIQ